MGGAVDAHELRIYEEVLGIPRQDCPPDYYLLLGISHAERDVEAIKAAAGERMARLRLRVSAEQARTGKAILKRMQKAQICLLDPHARAAYDATLTAGSTTQAKARTPSVLPDLQPDILDFDVAAELVLDEEIIPVSFPGKRHSLPVPRTATPKLQTAGWREQQRHPKVQIDKTRLASVILGSSLLLMGIAVAFFYFRGEESDTISRSMDQLSRVPASSATTAYADPEPNTESDIRRAPLDPKGNRKSQLAKSAVEEIDDLDSEQPKFSATNSFRIARSGQAEYAGQGASGKQVASAGMSALPPHTSPVSPADNNSNIAILAKLPVDTALPELRVVSTNLSNDSELAKSIVDFGPVPTEELEIEVDQPKVMTVEGIRFGTVADHSFELTPAWLIRLSSAGDSSEEDDKSLLDDVGQGFEEDIARLFVADGRLKFTWIGTDRPQMAQQLRNCAISLQYKGQRHRIQLRECQQIAPVRLDFEDASLVFTADGADLPAPESTFLHLEGIRCGSTKVEIDPANGVTPYQEILCIKLGENDQELEIRMSLRGGNEGYRVLLAPRFRIGTRWKVFSTSNINESLSGLQTAMKRQQKSLALARRKESSLPGQIAAARSRLSSDNIKERFAAENEVRRLNAQLVRAKSSVVRAQRSIADINRTEEQLNRFVSLGNSLRNSTELNFRVGVATESGDLNLLRTSNQIARVETRDGTE